MAVLIIYKFDEDSIKNEVAIIQTHFPHYLSMGDQRASNSHVNSPICPTIKLVCLFDLGLNVAFNNLSLILRRCLDVGGSSMLTFRVLPH